MWVHPRSKKLHQIDHFIVNREMFHRAIDAGWTPQLLETEKEQPNSFTYA